MMNHVHVRGSYVLSSRFSCTQDRRFRVAAAGAGVRVRGESWVCVCGLGAGCVYLSFIRNTMENGNAVANAAANNEAGKQPETKHGDAKVDPNGHHQNVSQPNGPHPLAPPQAGNNVQNQAVAFADQQSVAIAELMREGQRQAAECLEARTRAIAERTAGRIDYGPASVCQMADEPGVGCARSEPGGGRRRGDGSSSLADQVPEPRPRAAHCIRRFLIVGCCSGTCGHFEEFEAVGLRHHARRGPRRRKQRQPGRNPLDAAPIQRFGAGGDPAFCANARGASTAERIATSATQLRGRRSPSGRNVLSRLTLQPAFKPLRSLARVKKSFLQTSAFESGLDCTFCSREGHVVAQCTSTPTAIPRSFTDAQRRFTRDLLKAKRVNIEQEYAGLTLQQVREKVSHLSTLYNRDNSWTGTEQTRDRCAARRCGGRRSAPIALCCPGSCVVPVCRLFRTRCSWIFATTHRTTSTCSS